VSTTASGELAELRARVEAHLRQSGNDDVVEGIERLAGGACQENFRVRLRGGDGSERRLVLRADSKGSLPGSLDRAGEARVIDAAVAAGVRTPAARWPARDLTRPGATSYFLDWVEGEAIGRRVVKGPELAAARARLPGELAAELGRIHSITPATHSRLFARDDDKARPLIDPTDEAGLTALDPVRVVLDDLARGLASLPLPRPGLELALAWLRREAPARSEVTLVHGDFRVGNFMVSREGLVAVLDWEFARWGTPAEDLAWIAVRDWRFGRVELPIGGLAPRAPFYEAYEKTSGRRVNRREVHYWEVLGNVRWAMGSLSQGRRYDEGERDIELIAVARRAAEMEFEALRLIERGPA
jgi:aminoglycoside phosphotransferase (APT) family kinase protein